MAADVRSPNDVGRNGNVEGKQRFRKGEGSTSKCGHGDSKNEDQNVICMYYPYD